MNALFVPDSKRKGVTWIGSLGLVFRHHNIKTAIKLESFGSAISIDGRANISAKLISSIVVKKGMFHLSETTPFDGFRHPFVQFNLEDVGLSFSVMFKKEHLDLFWHSTQHQSEDSHGLIGIYHNYACP